MTPLGKTKRYEAWKNFHFFFNLDIQILRRSIDKSKYSILRKLRKFLELIYAVLKLIKSLKVCFIFLPLTEESIAKKKKRKTGFQGSPFAQRSFTINSRPNTERSKANESRSRIRSDSDQSLSRESLLSEGPDHMPHIRSSVVSTVDAKAPRSKLGRPRKTSVSEKSITDKPSRKKSRIPEKRGNVSFRVNYVRDKHVLEVHLINATGLPIRRGHLLDSFARISLKTPSKHQRHQSKVLKKTCNPIFDEKFVFESVYFSELQQANLKIKIMNRVGVSRCEPIGETAVALCDEDVMRGESLCRELFERAGKSQVSWVRNAC